MKRTTTTTIAALLLATMAAGAAAPALAQDQGAGGQGTQIAARGDADHGRRDGRRMQQRRGGVGGGILALVCEENGVDRLEHMLLSIAQRTDPTAAQQALYDDFKSAATSAQTDFAAACAAARPAEPGTAEGDLIERLTVRHELATARVAAMDVVLPAFEAFYDSLSDEQKLALEPKRGDDRGRGFGHDRRGGPGRG